MNKWSSGPEPWLRLMEINLKAFNATGLYYAPDVLEPWFSEKDEQSAVVHGNHSK